MHSTSFNHPLPTLKYGSMIGPSTVISHPYYHCNLPRHSETWETFHMSVVGPLPRSPRKYTFAELVSGPEAVGGGGCWLMCDQCLVDHDWVVHCWFVVEGLVICWLAIGWWMDDWCCLVPWFIRLYDRSLAGLFVNKLFDWCLAGWHGIINALGVIAISWYDSLPPQTLVHY